MPANGLRRNLPELLTQLEALAQSSLKTFSHLASNQLNWKPSADQWSIAQCFDHLITTNEPYFDIFDKIAKGQKKNTFWESMPFVPGFFGGMLIKTLSPESTRKLKAPKLFQPSSSDIDAQIIERFVSQLRKLAKAMAALEGKDLDAIRVTSPALKLITYSVRAACTIIVVHGQRHFQQAESVLSQTEFPRNEIP